MKENDLQIIRELIAEHDKTPERSADAAMLRLCLRDIDRLRIVAQSYRLALTAIAKDEALPCRCGEEPYTDGEECPTCTAETALTIQIDR